MGKGLRITKKDFDTYGYMTDLCPRCAYINDNGTGRGCTVAHTDECHKRIAEALCRTEEGRERVQRAIRRKELGKQATAQDKKKEKYPSYSDRNLDELEAK